MEEEFARQHIPNHHTPFVTDRAPCTDEKTSPPTLRPHVGRRQLIPSQRRQRSWNATGVSHSLLEIAVLVTGDHVDPKEMPKSAKIQPVPAASEFLRRDGCLPLQAILHQLPNLHGDLGAAAKNRFDRRGEPAIDRALEQIGGDEEDQNHRDKGQTDIGQHQVGAETTPENATPALYSQPDQIADEDEAEDEDEGDVEVPQDKQENPVSELFGG